MPEGVLPQPLSNQGEGFGARTLLVVDQRAQKAVDCPGGPAFLRKEVARVKYFGGRQKKIFYGSITQIF